MYDRNTPRSLRAALVCAAAVCLAAPAASGEEPPAPKGRARSVLVQGGVSGGAVDQPTPPAPVVTQDTRAARGAVQSPEGPAPEGAAVPVLRAVSLGDGEATLEVDGRRETVRPGSRLGGDTVKSVSAERLVLLRPVKDGDDALVIVTFAADGAARARTFWARDPSAPAREEVDQP